MEGAEDIVDIGDSPAIGAPEYPFMENSELMLSAVTLEWTSPQLTHWKVKSILNQLPG